MNHTAALICPPCKCEDLKEEVKSLRRKNAQLEEIIAMERRIRAAEILREGQR